MRSTTSLLLLVALFGAVCGHFFYPGNHGLMAQDSAETMVQKFLARMTRSIESKDLSIIRGLFQPNFVFKGCKGVYNKDQIVGLLSQIPAGTKFTFSLKSVNDNGSSIKYTVSATGFGASAIEADFVLNKVDQQLESGVVPACQKSHFLGFVGIQDSAEVMVQKFLARMTRSIESKDLSIIRGLFQPGFIFKGCKGIYNKDQIVGLLSQIPTGTKFTFTLKSVNDNGSSIKYTVSATGFGASAIEADFVLNKVDQQLESGVVPACQKSHFIGLVAQDSAQEMVEKFLMRMVRSVESKDASILAGLFQPGFLFKGCKGQYTKEQVIGILSNIPAGTKFSITLKSIQDNGDSIQYTVLASGFGASAIEADFVLNKRDQQLESGEIPKCQKSFYFSGFNDEEPLIGRSQVQNQDPIATTKTFLNAMKPILASHDATQIGTLFDDNFIFKGCRGTYSKSDAVNKLVSIPAESPLNFDLVTANWNGQGQIVYTVSVSLPMMENKIQAQFVYCPQRNVLKSGSVPQCPPNRFY